MGGSATSATLHSPNAVGVDNAGNFYITDEQNDVVREVSASTGIITTVAGDGIAGYSGDGGAATSAKMDWDIDVVFDIAGNMYISELVGDRIRKVDKSTGIITTFVGNGVLGYSGDGGSATSAEIDNPRYIAVDASDNLFFADQGNNRIRKVDLSTGIISTVVGTGLAGFSGDGGSAATAKLNGPYGITFDNLGNMFIGDQFNYCVREVNKTTNIITTVAGIGTVSGFSGDGGAATSATLSAAASVAVGPTGNIYIADTYNQRIRKVTKSTGIITTIAGTGIGGYNGDGIPAVSAEIYFPANVLLNSCGSLYISDWGNERIREVVNEDEPFLSITGDTLICSGSADTLTALGGTTYLWSTGATSSSIIVNPTSHTTYSVQISASGSCGSGSLDTAITVNINPFSSLVIGSPIDSICSGDSVALNVSGANTYSWTPSTGLSCTTCSNPIAKPTVSTTYVVTGHDIGGCTSSKSISVIVGTVSTLGVIPNINTCSGTPVTLTANGLSSANGTFVWQPGSETGASINISPTTTTTYTVQYSNACGATETTVTVFVDPAPTPSFSADVVQGCAPLCVQFRDLSTISSPGNITMWSWNFGNGDSAHAQNPLYCYPDTGTFTPSLTAVSNNGCSATLQIDRMITVFTKPIAGFIYAPQPINILNATVQFTDESTDAYGIAYRMWTFGDATDSISSLQNPSHTYQDTGNYCPKLVVENNKGCLDTATQCLDVEPIFTLYIPSSFSPNGDGLNEVFEPKGVYVKTFEMYVFDRWGMELYHTTDINQGWNGTVKGSTIAQEDSYVYKITATDFWNNQHAYTGVITLLK